MPKMKPITSPYLNLLRNHIDITHVPFSDRGSRILLFQEVDQSRLLVKLAERLTTVQPDIEALRCSPTSKLTLGDLPLFVICAW
jgi:hypothetical protein